MPLLTVNELEQMSFLFRGKVGNALAREIMKIVGLDKINDLYDRHSGVVGPDFTKAVFDDVGYSYRIHYHGEVISRDNLVDIIPSSSFITVSNHPCGHLDGMTLVDMFAPLRSDYKVMVNKILSRIRTLEQNFISVTPNGTQKTSPTSASISGIKMALKHLCSNGSLGLFPAGAVSDLQLLPVQDVNGASSRKEWRVEDRPWQEPVIRLIGRSRVPVVPVRFCGGNSPLYYRLGLIDWRVRLLRLLKEVFNKRGYVMDVVLGDPIFLSEHPSDNCSDGNLGEMLRRELYALEP
ncbi:MAG: hypothetical protein PUC72_02395 [Bacteroidales bacterium]|nr:hypothetical protein [Bacteroidales bacterium]